MKDIFKKIIVFLIEWESRLILWRHKPKIVAITGSVGKTSSKDAIFSVLSKSFFVRKSEKSFNSEVGVPLTIMACQNGWNNVFIWIKNLLKGLFVFIKRKYPAWLVLEVGADRPGDIQRIAKWIRPDIVVYSKFGNVPAHIEYYESREGLIEEKASLLKYLKPDGILILNYDDKDILSFRERSKNFTLTYGFIKGADILASNYSIIYHEDGFPKGITFRVDYKGNSVPVEIYNVLGVHHVYPALAAIALGVSQNINFVSIAESLKTHSGPVGRMNLIKGIKNTVIIDDTYNSSPAAALEALNTLRFIESKGRKISVLGDMLELGKQSIEEHKNIGKFASETSDILICVGIRARFIAEGALENGMNESSIYQFDDSREAGKHLEVVLREGDIALIKGSQFMRMERTVEEVMAFPLERRFTLVRQDKEWQKR